MNAGQVCTLFTSCLQVYREVLDWEPPVAGVRCILEFGETTLVSQVPEPSTLPPPAPVEVLDQYSDLPLLPSATNGADMLHGAFHEVRAFISCLLRPCKRIVCCKSLLLSWLLQ